MTFFPSLPARRAMNAVVARYLHSPALRYGTILTGVIGVAASLGCTLYRGPVPLPWDSAGGRGTLTDPYLIETCPQLAHAGNTFAYALTRDIDCTAFSASRGGFLPLGDRDGFGGALDGRGFTVRGVRIRQPGASNIGLFRVLTTSARVSRLVLDVDIVGQDNVGGLAGVVRTGANATGIIVRGRVRGRRSVGMLAGLQQGTMEDVRAEADVTGDDVVGGIVGYNAEAGLIRNAESTGQVRGGSNVGGIAGVNRGATIDGCMPQADVTGTEHVGAVVGWLVGGTEDASSVTRCDDTGLPGQHVLPRVGQKGLEASSRPSLP